MAINTNFQDPTHLFQELYSQLSFPSSEIPNEQVQMVLLRLKDLGPAHLEKLLAFLFVKIEENEENEVALCWLIGVLEGLVKSDLPSMTPGVMIDLQHALWPWLQNPSYKVKEAMAKLVLALGKGGHLCTDSAIVLIRFLIDECVKPLDNSASEEMEAKDERKKLKKSCLEILADCVHNPSMAKLMWPMLLEYIAPDQYASISLILSFVLYLAEKLQHEDQDALDINYSDCVLGTIIMPTANRRTPTPQFLLLQLMILSYSSQVNIKIRKSALRILSILHNQISKQLGKEWVLKIETLIGYLEGEETCYQKFWEENIFLFLEYTLQCITKQKWIIHFLEDIIAQLRLGQGTPNEKSFLYQSWGIAQKLVNCKSSEDHLWTCLESINCKEKEECEGFAHGVGIWASGHLQEALENLERMAMLIDKLHDGKMLYYLEVPTCKEMTQLLLHSYQKVLLLVPKEQLLPIVENEIIEKIVNCFNTSCPDVQIRREFIESVLMAGEIMAQGKGFFFKTHLRRAATNHLLQILAVESKEDSDTSVCSDIMTALSYLGELYPPLNEEEIDLVISCCLKSVFSMPPRNESLKGKSPLRTSMKSLCQKKIEALDNVIMTILESQPTPEITFRIFKHLSKWLGSEKPVLRMGAMRLSHLLFTFYYTSEDVRHLPCLGFFAGALVPRCFDQLPSIRNWASKTLTSVLQGNQNNIFSGPSEIEGYNLKTDAQEVEASNIMPIDIARLIFNHLPLQELLTFLYTASDGIIERVTCPRSIVFVLRMVVESFGARVKDEIPGLLTILVEMLHSLKDELVRRELTATVQQLTKLAPRTVVPCLLKNPLPYDKDIRELWRLLGNDACLAILVLPVLLHCNRGQKKETKLWLKSQEPIPPFPKETQALWEVTAALEFKEILEGLEDKLFTTYFLSLPQLSKMQVSESKIQSPSELASYSSMEDGFKNFLELKGFHSAVVQMENTQVWKFLQNAQFVHIGVTHLCRSLVQYPEILNRNVLHNLLPFLKSAEHEYRMVCTALFSELLGCQEMGMLEKNSLNSALKLEIERTQDVNPVIRFLAVRALGNALVGLPKETPKCKKIIFKVLTETLCWACDPYIIEETLIVLAKFVPYLKTLKRYTVLQLVLQIRALLRDEVTTIRLAAVTLYGLLLSFANKKPVFVDQVEKSLGSLLILLKDNDPRVVKSSRIVLRDCSSFLHSEPLKELLKNLQPEGEINFPQFYGKVYNLLMEEYSEKEDETFFSKAASASEIRCFMEEQDMNISTSGNPKEFLHLL
ncbi:maestro heat-like repeat-containing protein family member 1 isoform X1 [Monodelphis domestica]|uniref:maestro heat-like repeat-containing protein family member 1 isoform X1 n=2 Tax=Monodelphis domestica TaxID=13616 RepID=UPI0024E20613|nr:maestro heat-like repeat-containing protein family member 1 isoform X1 [Monodelphis domestica]